MSPTPVPPPQPPSSEFPHHPFGKPTSLGDVILTAFSLLVLFSSPKPSSLFFFPNTKICFPLSSRRFLRIPTMSQPFTGPVHPRNPRFATPQSLSDWLKPRLPSESFAAWGVKPGTKNVHNLWLEIADGETSLADSIPPVRTVEVVVVHVIGKDGKVLVESHQELSSGAIRARGRPLSEKMKPGESVEAAVFRAVKEELGSILKDGSFPDSDIDVTGVVKIVPDSYVKKVEERTSVSYPGLPACYVLHKVVAEVEGLPESDFFTEEVEEYENVEGRSFADCSISCKKHYWKWVDSVEP